MWPRRVLRDGPESARRAARADVLVERAARVTDGEDTPARRALHVDDVFVPSDPAELPAR